MIVGWHKPLEMIPGRIRDWHTPILRRREKKRFLYISLLISAQFIKRAKISLRNNFAHIILNYKDKMGDNTNFDKDTYHQC